jgi:hypothetical protein
MVGIAMNDLADSASEQWQELWSLTAQLQAAEPTELVKFHGGNQREDGLFVMPWASYDATVNRIEELLYDLNVVQDLDWSGWQSAIDPDSLFDTERIKSGTLYDTVCLLTGIIRSERFGSDAIATSLLNGGFLALLARLKILVSA